MKNLERPQSVRRPRWDGSRILFDIKIEGRPVACAISRGALQEISGCRHIASADLLGRFASGRERIETVAVGIFAVRPESVTGTVNIWADDIDDPPSAPAVARPTAEASA